MSGPGLGPARTRLLLGVAIAVIVVAGLVVAGLLGRDTGSPSEARTPATSAPGVTEAATGPPTGTAAAHPVPAAATGPAGGLVVNTTPVDAGAPTIDIYSDPQCPWCKRAHDVLAAGFTEVLADGKATVRLHLKTFLDDNLGNDSSKAVAGAAACASDAGRLWPYYSAALAAQPASEGQGFTDAQVQRFATDAGITGADLTTWRRCVAEDRYAAYVAAVEEESTRDGVRGTPTYRVNGTDIDLDEVFPPDGSPPDPDAFFAAAGVDLQP